MDLKENNVKRLHAYHGIISDGVHKIDLAEERITTLFLGLVNPGEEVLILSPDVLDPDLDASESGLNDFAKHSGSSNANSWWEFFFGG
ncbi:hypothetical protein HN709_05220 [Candidatus Peregrinibacteria bacterium]|nr:hypothetical protein [Candidatus Peregrinibacteria bacterium]